MSKTSGTFCHLKFNEKQGTTAYDSSRYKNNASLGSGTAAYMPVWTEKGLRYDGTNDFVQVGGDDSFKTISEGAIMGWINVADLSVDRTFFAIGPKIAVSPVVLGCCDVIEKLV